jgi:uncharacterized protein
MRRVVLDTNCLLQSLSRRSRYHRVWRDFVEGRYALCVTTEILAEYEEIVSRYMSPVVGRLLIEAILRANNVVRVDAQFRFNLITRDPDDNKFVDCAIVANAEFVVTNDAHFTVLKTIPFPHVRTRTIEEFLALLEMDDSGESSE